MRQIPQCDPHASYLADQDGIDRALARALAAGRYVLGPEVTAFEAEFAAFCGVGHAVGVANGTDALELGLRACGVGPGDLVATVSHTAVATTVAIRATGASPLFVDVDPEHGVMDVNCLADTLCRATADAPALPGTLRAIVPVHLYGRCADMPRILDLADRHGLAVVEDCAQAHGASLDGRLAGSWGRCGSFSFYPTKNLGAFGDGGAVVTGDEETAARIRLLREYGWRSRYISDIEGGNSRLDELQAALLRVKLQRLERNNTRRIALAARYRRLLAHPLVALTPETEARHVYHQFTVRSPLRDELRAWLVTQGIGSLVHYPVPVHLQPAYSSGAFRILDLPETERWAREVLSLPMYPELTDVDVDYVADAINRWAP